MNATDIKDEQIVKKITKDNATTYFNDLSQDSSVVDLRIDHISLLNDLHILRAIKGAKNYFAGNYKRAFFIGLKHPNETKAQSHRSDMNFLELLIRTLSD